MEPDQTLRTPNLTPEQRKDLDGLAGAEMTSERRNLMLGSWQIEQGAPTLAAFERCAGDGRAPGFYWTESSFSHKPRIAEWARRTDGSFGWAVTQHVLSLNDSDLTPISARLLAPVNRTPNAVRDVPAMTPSERGAWWAQHSGTKEGTYGETVAKELERRGIVKQHHRYGDTAYWTFTDAGRMACFGLDRSNPDHLAAYEALRLRVAKRLTRWVNGQRQEPPPNWDSLPSQVQAAYLEQADEALVETLSVPENKA